MSASLRIRLLTADEMFLDVMAGDATAFQKFEAIWMDIQESLDLAISQGTADKETLSLASKISNGIATITGSFISLYEDAEAISKALRAELESLFTRFAQLSLNDDTSIAGNPDQYLTPAYIKPAYDWLLQNLHNPYPSTEQKATIARHANSTVRLVSSWFRDIRKRIMWTDVMQKHFSNKRTLIVQAAIRHFNPPSSSSTSRQALEESSSANIMFEEGVAHFVQIEANAMALYQKQIAATKLAESIVSGPIQSYPSPADTPSPISLPTLPQAAPLSEKARGKRRRDSDILDVSENPFSKRFRPNPSDSSTVATKGSTPASPGPPSRSQSRLPSASPYPETPTPSASRAQSVVPQISSIGKRKRLVSDEGEQRTSPAPPVTPPAGFGSATPGTLLTPDVTPPSTLSLDQNVRKRKRRLSDADTEQRSRRPHNSLAVPRLQTVSDPFPLSQQFQPESQEVPQPVFTPQEFEDLWNFTLSSTLDVDPAAPIILDETTPLDVEYANLSEFANIVPPSKGDDIWSNVTEAGHAFANIPSATELMEAFASQNNSDVFAEYGQVVPPNDEGQAIDPSLLSLPFDFNLAANPLDHFNIGLSADSLAVQPNPDFFNHFPGQDQWGPWQIDAGVMSPATFPNTTASLFDTTNQPQLDSTAAAADKLAKLERAERLRQELRLIEADLST